MWPAMPSPDTDGIDHINVYSKGRTLIGRMMSHFYDAPIELPALGRFRTVEGLWYWLSCRDDRLRSTDGYNSKKLGRELRGRGADWPRMEGFEQTILDATRWKVAQHVPIFDELVKSQLPFKHYYVSRDGAFMYVRNSDWLLEGWEAIRREAKAYDEKRRGVAG